MTRDPASLRSRIAQLEEERRAVVEEMRAYSTPIAGCDQQYNFLMEQRAALSGELARLRALDPAPSPGAGPTLDPDR